MKIFPKKITINLINIATMVFLFLPFNNAQAGKHSFRLNCMTQKILDATLASQNISPALSSCSKELKDKLNDIDPQLNLTDVHEVILAMIVAHNTAPYGESNAYEYSSIIKEQRLNCGNQTILMGYLLPKKNIHILGFDGGVIGNHGQVLYTNKEISLLLDPTTSVIAKTTYNALLQGKPIENVIIIHPNLHNDSHIYEYFTNKVVTALLEGAYLPTDILYYYESLNHMIGKGPADPYITPAGISWRKMRL